MKTMESTWQIAKKLLLIEEAKKQSDTAHTYSLEIGRRRAKPLPVELEQYLISQTERLYAFTAEGDRSLLNHWQERNIDTLDRDLLEPY